MPTQPTPASLWKKSGPEGFVVELPSGQAVMMHRNVDFFAMLREGNVPNPLQGIISKMVTKIQGGDDTPIAVEPDEEAMRAMFLFIDQMVCDVVLDPLIVMPPIDPAEKAAWQQPENTVSIDDVEPDDRMFIFQVALGGAADLERFRKQQAEAVEATQDVQVVQPAPIVVPRVKRSTLPGVVPR